jgi:hypothetical protein
LARELPTDTIILKIDDGARGPNGTLFTSTNIATMTNSGHERRAYHQKKMMQPHDYAFDPILDTVPLRRQLNIDNQTQLDVCCLSVVVLFGGVAWECDGKSSFHKSISK